MKLSYGDRITVVYGRPGREQEGIFSVARSIVYLGLGGGYITKILLRMPKVYTLYCMYVIAS